MALDDEMDEARHHVRVPALTPELVAGRSGEFVGPHTDHLLHEGERTDFGNVGWVWTFAEPKALGEEEVCVLERSPFAICWFCRDFLRVALQPWPTQQPEDEAK